MNVMADPKVERVFYIELTESEAREFNYELWNYKSLGPQGTRLSMYLDELGLEPNGD